MTPHDDAPAGAEARLVAPGARRFVDALRAVEHRGDLQGMVDLAGDHTRWWSTGTGRTDAGRDGAERFWSAYRRSFAEIASEFTEVTETPARVVLEWSSRGRHHSGRPVRYAGATVIDLDDGTGDDPSVAAVRLYYDTAAALAADPDADDTEPSMLDRETAASGVNSGLAPAHEEERA